MLNTCATQSHRQFPEQLIEAYSFAVDEAKGAEDALDAASSPHGGAVPDAMFLVAGTARPGFFVEQTEESFALSMQETYWAQAWSALVRGRIIVCKYRLPAILSAGRHQAHG